MSNSTETKALEVKIRPYPTQVKERPDHNGLSRVLLSSEALIYLGLKSGAPCYIWKVEEDGPDTKREAIAWLATEKNLKNAQITKTFQAICGFKLGDDVKISAGPPGGVPTAESVILKDITQETPELKERDLAGWEWMIKENLSRAEYVFAGMTFEKISARGPRRTFIVDSVNNRPTGQAKFDEEMTSVNISKRVDSFPQINGERPRLDSLNIAGIDQALEELNDFLGDFHREFLFSDGDRSCAALVHGSAGTGKTHVLNKVTETGWGKVHRIKRGVKPAAIPAIFKDAKLAQPSIVVIDDLEKLVSKDDPVSESIADIIGEELDNLVQGCTTSLPKVLVIAATTDFSKIPNFLKQSGRFTTDILLPIPDAAARKAILRSKSPKINPNIIDEAIESLGDRTHAYTPGDLTKLLNRAIRIAEKRLRVTGSKEVFLEQDDIEQALLRVRPTAMHDITLQPPKVRWDEIGGQESVKQALRDAVETPLKHPERLQKLAGDPKKGLLLYGPPGCSKTLSAQAMATEVGFNFFAVKGAELLDQFVGNSEKAVRAIFERARQASPSIIFFDEIDAIGGKRAHSGRNTGVNVLTTLLNEMDGIESLKGVLVLAATNQPQSLDTALLRPGRFDQLIYVAPPDLAGREAILRVRQRKSNFADDVDIPELARQTDGYSGAEMVGIFQNAVNSAMKKWNKTGLEQQVQMGDFEAAIKAMKKQITPEMVQSYERWAAGARGDSD